MKLRRAKAFVLPMTLVLLALAAAVMVNFCTRSMTLAAEASHAEDDLQQRWAMASIRRAVLPQAEILLDDVEQSINSPTSQRKSSITLGHERFDLLITDEQAKANVNAILSRLGQSRTEQTLHELLARRKSDIRIDLRPLAPIDATHPAPFDGAKRIGSFAQVFAANAPTALLAEPSVLSSLTCFGDGRINLRRTNYPALLGLTRELLTQKQVVTLLQSQRDMDISLDQLLAPLTLTPQSLADVRSMITFKSACHGLWITSPEQSMLPASGSFAVTDDTTGANEQVMTW